MRNRPGAIGGQDVVWLAGVLAIGVLVPVVVGAAAGSLDVPRNDDWVYRRIALDYAGTGVLSLHNVTTMMIGQIVVAQPFLWVLAQPSAFTVAGVLFAGAAATSAYVLARQFLRPARAALATALLLLFPAYLAYATSFMTDVPAIAAQCTCLTFGVLAFRQQPVSYRWLVAAAIVGGIGMSMREFAVAAPASVALAVICAEPKRLKSWAFAVAVAGSFVLLFALKATLPGQNVGSTIGDNSIFQSTYGLSSVSLVLLPAAVLGGLTWRRHMRPIDLSIGAELGLVVVAVRVLAWVQSGSMPGILMGNLASPWGAPAPAYVLGGRPLLFDDVSWRIVGLVAIVATVVVPSVAAGMVGAYFRSSGLRGRGALNRLGSPIGMLLVFSVLVAGGLTIFGLKAALYDRYYWPMIPVIAALLLLEPKRESEPSSRTSRRLVGGVAIGATALLAVVSSIFMLNSFAFDSARWRAGDRLVELGIRPDQVDAGYEWVGYYQPELPAAMRIVPKLTFYETLWPGRRSCGIVTSRQEVAPAGAIPVGIVTYRLFLFVCPEEPLYLYRTPEQECVVT